MKLYEISEITSEPLIRIGQWLKEAEDAGSPLPHAMNVATVNESGFPSSRMVLLKSLSEEGLVFFTDYSSKKGLDLMNNGRAAINFWWAKTNKAIRLEGICSKVSQSLSDDYFNSRPLDSKISASVSFQSNVIVSYKDLINEAEEFKKNNENEDIKRPQRWGGFIFQPNNIEFWKDELNRLHLRENFKLSNTKWKKVFLSP